MRESEAGNEFRPISSDSLDSDDDEDQSNSKPDSGEEEEDEGADLLERLKSVDINDAEQVWSHLTANERKEFESLLATGEIMKLVPSFNPWWTTTKSKRRLIEEIPEADVSDSASKLSSLKPSVTMPTIIANIPKFSDICRKEPSPSVHYNLWNIMASYTCMVRFFAGEHATVPSEATACLINLSACLKYGTNFEDVEEALLSVEMEAKTTDESTAQQLLQRNIRKKNESDNETPRTGSSCILLDDRDEFISDVRRVMMYKDYKLAALSDMLGLFRSAKEALKQPLQHTESEDGALLNATAFHKLFALCGGGMELTKRHLCQLTKKIQFYLSYVNREA